jgi:putative MATE family efflux protein
LTFACFFVSKFKKGVSRMKENKMGVAPVNRLLLSMAAPMVLSMLVGALYNVVDSLFVSYYSKDALTAVSLAFPIQNIIIAIGTGLGVGVNALLSRFLGERRQDDVNKTAIHGILLGLIFYAAMLLFGIFCVRPFYLIQTDIPEIVDMGVGYLSVICVFSFGQMFQLIFEKLLQSTGRTAYTMGTQLVGSIVNLILDPILIFGLFGIPRMGTKGAAIATVIGQIVAMLLGVFFNLTRNHEIQFSLKGFRVERQYLGQICIVGIPTIIMQSMSSVMSFGINKLLLGFSTTATAVFGAYFKLQTFVYMAVFGLNNALIPIVAYNLGAQKADRIKKAILLTGAYSALIGLVGTAILEFGATPIMLAFHPSDTMLDMGVTALRILSLSFMFGSATVMCSYALQGFSRGVSSLVISAGRQVIVLIPLAYIMGRTMGLNGVWWSFLIAEAAVMVLALGYLKVAQQKVEEQCLDGE